MNENLKRNEKIYSKIRDNYLSLEKPNKLTFEGANYRRLLEKRKQLKKN